MRTAIGTILLVDDDPDDAFLLEKALAELPVPVVLYSIDDCDELLAAVALHRPDLIFMDMNMPKHNGLECMELLRSVPTLPAVPVVLYSSSEQPTLVDAAYASGAALFFRKPSSFDGMVAALDGIIGLDWAQPEAIRATWYGAGWAPAANSSDSRRQPGAPS